MKDALNKVKIIKCKRQAPELGRILWRSYFFSNNSYISVKNWSKNYFCCQYISKSTEHTRELNCDSKDLIYVLICSGCKKEYIGQTQTILEERLNTYRQHIRQNKLQQKYIERHLSICGQGQNDVVKMMPLFCNSGR